MLPLPPPCSVLQPNSTKDSLPSNSIPASGVVNLHHQSSLEFAAAAKKRKDYFGSLVQGDAKSSCSGKMVVGFEKVMGAVSRVVEIEIPFAGKHLRMADKIENWFAGNLS